MSRPTAKRQLEQIMLRAYVPFTEMTQAQRRRALRALDALTETNCSWQLFNARDLLRWFIAMASPIPRRKPTTPATAGSTPRQ